MAYVPVETFDTRTKNVARDLAVSDAKGQTGLFLPSTEGLCVRHAARYSSLETIVCCERDQHKIDELVQNLTQWQIRARDRVKLLFHHGNVQDLDPHVFNLDYIFLDLCGTMSAPVADWLGAFIYDETEIAVTLTQSWRVSKYMKQVCRLLKEESKFLRRVRRYFSAPLWYADSEGNLTENKLDGHVLIQVAMLHLIFAGCGLSFKCGVTYLGATGSGTPMATLRFTTNPRTRGLSEAPRLKRRLDFKISQLEDQDPWLLDKAYQCYRTRKWDKLRSYWGDATSGQRGALSRRCGENLSEWFCDDN